MSTEVSLSVFTALDEPLDSSGRPRCRSEGDRAMVFRRHDGQEIADILGIATSTVHRDPEFGKVWIAREMRSINDET